MESINFDDFTTESEKLAVGLKEAEVTKKAKGKKSVQGEFNSCAFISEKLHGQLWRCAISGRIYRTSDDTEVTESNAKTMCFDMKMVAGIAESDFWLYLGGDYIEERNPLKFYFEALPTPKNNDSIKTFFDALILTEKANSEFLYRIFRKWLIGAVAMLDKKQFYPNTLCPVLMSDIHAGKTSFFKKLTFNSILHDYTTTHRFSGGAVIDKDTQSIFASCFLVLLDDLDKSDFKQKSAFRTLVSAEKFFHRPPYAKIERERARIASICGTTNYRDIIGEAQNNRRIVPIEIDYINFEVLNKVCANDIWAEAWQAYKANETWLLTEAEVSFIQRISGAYTDTAGLGDYILQCIVPCDKRAENAKFASSTDLYEVLIAQNPNYNKNYNIGQFAGVLKDSGFVYGSRRVEGKAYPIKGYFYKEA